MNTYRDTLICVLFLLITIAFQAYPVAFEKREPRDERVVTIPGGARPMLTEEYPRKQLVVERIRERHQPVLFIPFVRSWNTAAITALRGLEMEQEPEIEPDDFELGFALHSQRMRVGALRNIEYFHKETEGFPEGWYRPLDTIDYYDRPKGYMSTTFMHLAAKRIRRKYTDYRDFTDHVGGILNAIMAQNKQVTFAANRDMHNLRAEGGNTEPRVRNNVEINYKMPGENIGRLEVSGSSIWSTLTDSTQRDFRYISGQGSALWGRKLSSDVNLDLGSKFQISTFRDQTNALSTEPWDIRKSGWLQMIGTIALADPLRLKLDLSALYDSEYKFFFTPAAELALLQYPLEIKAGIRKRAILPDHDEIYWPSKFVKVNDDLEPESFLEGYGSFKLDIIAHLTILANATYSQPKSRITWEQLPGYVWEPKNVETSNALTGEASIIFNLISTLDIFASGRYQRFDNQRFDPEIVATGGLSYGNPTSGSITLGASFWNFQPLEDMDSVENLSFAYGRINKYIRRTVGIFVDGRYTFNDDAIRCYQGMPQAGRIVSVGANIVFGGLE